MMKIPTLACCLAGVLVTGAAACQDGGGADRPAPVSRSGDYVPDLKSRSGERQMSDRELRDHYRRQDHTLRDRYTGVSVHAGARLHSRDILFPELQDEQMVADKVAEIITKQRKEAAELQAMAPAARTVGFENVSTVFDYLAADHTTLADFGARWLSDRGYPVPAVPIETTVADSPADSVEHQLRMHEQALQEALDKRRNETSSTVRGMLLWGATTTTHHLSLLRTLDRDVDLGRKTTSAMLRMQLTPAGVATASSTELIEQYIAEERALFPPPPAPVVQTVVEERIVERIVEKPVIVEKIVERVVEKPVIVEKIVDRVVYVDRPAGTSRVAGQRQTTRARARRPAK